MKNLIYILSFIFSLSFIQAQEKAKNIFDVARSGTVADVKELMEKNPDVINQTNENGFSPLILACYRGNTDVAKFLIDHVKDINYKSEEGTALAGLSVRYQKDLVLALLNKNADPNIADVTGTTPLIWAVKTGNEELVRVLLEYKANKEQADNLGVKPFEYAVQTKKNNIINLLKSN